MNAIVREKIHSQAARMGLYRVKVFYRRFRKFLFLGLKYISISALGMQLVQWCCRNPSRKKIIWVGAFPWYQANIGDHAQTLAAEKLFVNILLRVLQGIVSEVNAGSVWFSMHRLRTLL